MTLGLRSSPQKPTVLVVEDDADLRGFYRTALIAAGFTVDAVEDGIDALNRIEGGLPALVVLDIVLPRLNGRDVQRELHARADTRHIPIIVVTATDTSDLDPSTVAYILRKPVAADTLVAAVEECLRSGGHRAALQPV